MVEDVNRGGHRHGVVWGTQGAPEGDVIAESRAVWCAFAAGAADVQRAVSG